jgi:peptide/nickel transport system ATP-binding protein
VADNIPWDHACAFAPRCHQEGEKCRTVAPDLLPDEEARTDGGLRLLRCHYPLTAADRQRIEEGRA